MSTSNPRRVLQNSGTFCGLIDDEGLKTSTGCQKYTNGPSNKQKYSGEFLHNNLHRQGIYTIDKKSHSHYYDGFFYCNKLEGYGQVVYPDGRNFEGLFRSHQRFGPGILTYPDGSQDVGLWNGFSLVRLSSVTMQVVPRLGSTDRGKAKLLKFRDLVPITPESQVASDKRLYNHESRSAKSLFFDKGDYDDHFYAEEDCTIEIVVSDSSSSDEETISEKDPSKASVERSNNNCDCFQLNQDRFAHISLHLHQIELKLEKLNQKKARLVQKFEHCRLCCEKRQGEVGDFLEFLDQEGASEAEVEPPLEHLLVPSIEMQEDEIGHLEIEDIVKVSELGLDSGATSDYEDAIKLARVSFVSEDPHRDRSKSHELKDQGSGSVHSMGKRSGPSKSHQELVSPCSLGGVFRHSHSTLPFGSRHSSCDDLQRYLQDVDAKGEEWYYELSQPERVESDYFQPTLQPEPPPCECSAFFKEHETMCSVEKKLESVNRELCFTEVVKKSLQLKLKVEYENLHPKGVSVKKKKVVVTDLVAWNNEEAWVRMLRHCFKNRRTEQGMTYSVSDLLTGKIRNDHGLYEDGCIKFLQQCHNMGDSQSARSVFELLKANNINPDLCDARGNTGVMLATVSDNVPVLQVLVNCGCNVNVLNDEGITPLLMSILRFLAVKNDVKDWEKAFLKDPTLNDEDLIELQQWRPHESLLSTTNFDQKLFPDMEGEVYILSTDFVHYKRGHKEKKKKPPKDAGKKKKKDKKKESPKKGSDKKKKGKDSKKSGKSDKKSGKGKGKGKKKSDKGKAKTSLEEQEKLAALLEAERLKLELLETVRGTILALLNLGASPDKGQVPLKPLLLAIFSDDDFIVERLLSVGRADPNICTTDEEKLTPLHVLVVQRKLSRSHVAMCKALLDHGADPNCHTGENFWHNLNSDLKGHHHHVHLVDNDNYEKSPIDLLCSREDFPQDTAHAIREMAKLIITHPSYVASSFLGHTPLSLAVLKHNLGLIEVILNLGKVDPYQHLGYDMGNVMTIMALRRFATSFNPHYESSTKIVDLLLRHHFNPLNPMLGFENVPHFIEKEKTMSDMKLSKKGGLKVSAKQTIDRYIVDKCRDALIAHQRCKIVLLLYCFIGNDLYRDELIRTLARFFPDHSDEVLEHIKLLFQYEVLSRDCFSYEAIADVLNFIKSVNFVPSDVVESTNNVTAEQTQFESNIDEEYLLKMKIVEGSYLNLKTSIRVPVQVDCLDSVMLLKNEEDDEEKRKYKVCFQCLRKSGRRLIKCPTCEVVYFCSELCNLTFQTSNRNYHPCDLTFYGNIYQIIGDDGYQPSRLDELKSLAVKIAKERRAKEELQQLEDKMQRLKFKPSSMTRKFEELCYRVQMAVKDRKKFAQLRKIPYTVDELKKTPAHHDNDKFVELRRKISEERKVKMISSSVSNVESLPHVPLLKLAKHSGDVLSPSHEEPGIVDGTSTRFDLTLLDLDDMDLDEEEDEEEEEEVEVSVEVLDQSEATAVKKKSKSLMRKISRERKKRRKSASRKVVVPPVVHQQVKKESDIGVDIMAEFMFRQQEDLFKRHFGDCVYRYTDRNRDYYMRLLSKVFADFNLPLLLLPYACFKDGQVYYSMSNNAYFGKSFQKFKIPLR